MTRHIQKSLKVSPEESFLIDQMGGLTKAWKMLIKYFILTEKIDNEELQTIRKAVLPYLKREGE